MMRLIESVMQTPEESLVLWKKYAFIKQCLTRACENEFFDAHTECFAAFICILGLQNISINQLITIDPAKKITDEVNLVFNAITSNCKNATADDLISISIGLLPPLEDYELFYPKLNMLYQIRQMQYGYDSIAGCYVTLISALSHKIQKTLSDEVHEDDAHIDKIISNIKISQIGEQKATFGKLFSDQGTDTLVKCCVNAYEQVFENKNKFDADMNIFSFYRKQLEEMMFETCKTDEVMLKKYFPNNDVSNGFKLILNDYNDSKSVFCNYLISHTELKTAFGNYSQAVKMLEPPSDGILSRLWLRNPFSL